MHILLLHQLFSRVDEPGLTQHYDYCRHLVVAGHRVTVLVGTRSYLTGQPTAHQRRELVEPGLEVIPCAVRASVHRSFFQRALGFFSFMVSAFLRGLSIRDVDLVWCTSPPLPQVCSAWALSWLMRAPLVFEVRDPWPEAAVQVGVLHNRLLIALARAVEDFLYRRARRVVINSPGYIPYMQQHRVPEAKIVLVPNGVNLALFTEAAMRSGPSFRHRQGLEKKFIALYTGAHGLSNDLDTVLQAAERLRHQRRIHFVLVGDGKEKPRLMAEAQRLGLENVLFLPAVPKEDIPRVLASADCGLAVLKGIPLFATTYPNKVFDYMAAARPVVLAIDGVIREVVERAGAGVAVPPGDARAMAEAVRALSKDPVRARRMGRSGRACVEAEFDRRAIARWMEHVLLEAAASPPI